MGKCINNCSYWKKGGMMKLGTQIKLADGRVGTKEDL